MKTHRKDALVVHHAGQALLLRQVRLPLRAVLLRLARQQLVKRQAVLLLRSGAQRGRRVRTPSRGVRSGRRSWQAVPRPPPLLASARCSNALRAADSSPMGSSCLVAV